MREIALDTETTGLDPASGHRVVEIGCVEMIGHVRTGNHFHSYLNPERAMPREAENIHGLSDVFLRDKPLFRTVARSFLEFIGDDPLVIHNASFDLKFLNAELNALDLPLIESSRATDTVLIARRMFPGSPANLDALCKRFNVDTAARTKHGALLDAELLADVYLELKGGRQSSLLAVPAPASSPAENGTGAGGDLVFSGHTDIPARRFSPSLEERAAHKAMIGKLKNPLWAGQDIS
ncbi:MAG: DNA polymerase III subunit epsilon [Alphaproteobacteria bacterium]|nr:DNA polymerase III subunit epsilon [Alphaproteobacteria bacterium]